MAVDRVTDLDALVTSGVVDRRVENCSVGACGLAKGIDGQLVEHIAGQGFFPEVTILRVEDGDDLSFTQHDKIGARGRRLSTVRIVFRQVRQHVAKAHLVAHRQPLKMVVQEARDEGLEEAVHVKEKAR